VYEIDTIDGVKALLKFRDDSDGRTYTAAVLLSDLRDDADGRTYSAHDFQQGRLMVTELRVVLP
jgi:hypothetical protein